MPNNNSAEYGSPDGIGRDSPDFKYVPEIPKAWDVPTLVSQCVMKNVAVTKRGKTLHMPAGEARVEKMFYDAINGDAKSAKQLLRWATKCIPIFKMPPVKGKFGRRWFDDSDVKHWKEIGCLPPDAPDSIMKVSVALLNKALKLWMEQIRQENAAIAAEDAKREEEEGAAADTE